MPGHAVIVRSYGLPALTLVAAFVFAQPAFARPLHTDSQSAQGKPRFETTGSGQTRSKSVTTTTVSTVTTTVTTGGGDQAGAQSAEGIVQSLSARAVVLRQLDGTTLTIALDRSTRLLLDGAPAHLGDIKPGFVVVASWTSGRAASELSFSRSS